MSKSQSMYRTGADWNKARAHRPASERTSFSTRPLRLVFCVNPYLQGQIWCWLAPPIKHVPKNFERSASRDRVTLTRTPRCVPHNEWRQSSNAMLASLIWKGAQTINTRWRDNGGGERWGEGVTIPLIDEWFSLLTLNEELIFFWGLNMLCTMYGSNAFPLHIYSIIFSFLFFLFFF